MSTTALTPGSRADRIREMEETRGFADEVNVGEAERLACGVAGAALVAVGLRRGGWGGTAIALLGGALGYRAVTGHCEAYEALNISTAGKSRTYRPVHRGLKITETFTINRPPEECYRFWRDFRNLPRIMEHLESVTVLDEGRSRWVARGPLGAVSWDAEIIADVPNELISWRSLEGADVDNAGSVRFRAAPGNRGTVVAVELNFEPPAGRLGDAIARLFGEHPEQQVRDDLRHFKQLMEAGEIPTVQGQPSGRS
jgi:uncharacterized membrane protein